MEHRTNAVMDWLKGVGVHLPPGLDEADCRRLAERPDESVYTEMASVRRLVVHHSATSTGSAGLIRVLHRGVFGWDDIGYHYVIGNGTTTAEGLVEEGRPEWAVGAHSRGNNGDSLGICMVGHFGETAPGTRQMQSLGELLSDMLGRYDLGREAIRLHRQMPDNSTSCPGEKLPLEAVLRALR